MGGQPICSREIGGATRCRRPPRTTCHSQRCYLEASKVDSPAGALSELSLVITQGKPIGSIAGVVIEPAARRVRYLDVLSTGWRRRHYLVSADQLTQIDSEKGVLRLLDTDIAEVGDVDAAGLHRFSDEDLLTAVFSSRGA